MPTRISNLSSDRRFRRELVVLIGSCKQRDRTERFLNKCVLVKHSYLTLNKRKHKERYCAREDQRSWSYRGYTNGPTNWPRLFPTCAGDKQSPVDIRTNKVTVDAELSDLRFVGYDTPVTNALVTNNGGTIRITLEDQVRRFIFVDNKEYDLQQFHFHWGTAKNPGAEHAINGFRNTVEIHFVHSNGNSTAVVGTLYEVDRKNNTAFWPIVKVLPEVKYKDLSATIKTPFTLNSLLPKNRNFYRYMGSLTTPNCQENVIWSVMQDIQNIGDQQLQYFLKLYSVEKQYKSRECHITGNYRPLQRLNGRIISGSTDM
ncbi:UNVERIFIED_CONTAM: Carbonic anhydrase 14 [Trichonephila clavipes]